MTRFHTLSNPEQTEKRIFLLLAFSKEKRCIQSCCIDIFCCCYRCDISLEHSRIYKWYFNTIFHRREGIENHSRCFSFTLLMRRKAHSIIERYDKHAGEIEKKIHLLCIPNFDPVFSFSDGKQLTTVLDDKLSLAYLTQSFHAPTIKNEMVASYAKMLDLFFFFLFFSL